MTLKVPKRTCCLTKLIMSMSYAWSRDYFLLLHPTDIHIKIEMSTKSVLSFNVICETESSSIVTPISIWSCHDSKSYLWNSIRIIFLALLTILVDKTLEFLPFVVRWDSLAWLTWRMENNMTIGSSMVVLIRCCMMSNQTVSRVTDMETQSSIKVEPNFGNYSTGCNDDDRWNNSQCP